MIAPLVWLSLTFSFLCFQGCYSMVEMAAVSMNKVRLAYLAHKGVRRAKWLQYLLQKPSRLFGSIMLGVHTSIQIGSQCAREFYQSINLDPDFAPLTQILIVVIFAELSPLFAARRCSEHVIMLGTPIIYATFRLFAPLIWCLSFVTRIIYFLLGKREGGFDVFLSREELEKVLQSHREEESDELNLVISNIFSLRNKTAHQAMTPLKHTKMMPVNSTVLQLRGDSNVSDKPFIPLFHKRKANIVAIAYPKDFLRLSPDRPILEYSRTPWFVSTTAKLMPILHQFRQNKESVAVVLDRNGTAVGVLTLTAILEQIIGESKPLPKKRHLAPPPLIERTFQGNTRISEFNREYSTQLPLQGVETLAQLLMTRLNHPVETGDSVIVDQYELVAEETNLLGVKSVTVKSLET
ncbi:MAG: CNNM domain-containing protein [Chlamydiales bacterium]